MSQRVEKSNKSMNHRWFSHSANQCINESTNHSPGSSQWSSESVNQRIIGSTIQWFQEQTSEWLNDMTWNEIKWSEITWWNEMKEAHETWKSAIAQGWKNERMKERKNKWNEWNKQWADGCSDANEITWKNHCTTEWKRQWSNEPRDQWISVWIQRLNETIKKQITMNQRFNDSMSQ